MSYKENNKTECFNKKEKLIMNIRSYLSNLSTVRVNKTKIKENYDDGYINTWPLYYDNVNIDVMDHIKKKASSKKRIYFLK